MVLYCAADLIWATRIRAAAEAAGIPSRPVRDLAMLEARLADSPVRGLIVDLEALPQCATECLCPEWGATLLVPPEGGSG